MIGGIILLIIAIGLWAMSFYNSMNVLKTKIKASIQEIGNQLKRQASLIPNLEASVKSYLKHEKGIYELITKTRASVADASKDQSIENLDKALDNVNKLLPKINVLVESNPELKANTTINKFMDELRDTADKLSYARRTLIDLSQRYNAKLVTFPNNILAGMFGFTEAKGLSTPMTGSHVEVSEQETKDVKVDLDK